MRLEGEKRKSSDTFWYRDTATGFFSSDARGCEFESRPVHKTFSQKVLHGEPMVHQ